MIRLLLPILILCFNSALNCFGQSGFPKYYAFYETWKKGDSCLKAQDFQRAGYFYYKAANAEIEKGIDIPREGLLYSAASAYALAGKKKMAFQILNKLVLQYHDINGLVSDSTFLSLHKQKEWKPIIEKIDENHRKWIENEKMYSKRTHFDKSSDEIIFYPHQADFTKNILNQDTLPFLSISHGIFRIYFSGNSYAADHLSEIKNQVNVALSNGLEILNIEKYTRGTTLIFFDSSEEMKSVTGVRALGGIAYPRFDTGLFPITAIRRPQFKHEIFHILSLNTWGPSNSRLLIEGSAVYADNECHFENPIPTINAYYLQADQLVPLDSLINHFNEIARKSDVLAYLQSAGVFKYLFEYYGLEKMKLLWVKGFDDFESIYGFSVGQLERDWLNFIKAFPIPEDFDIDKLKEGCG